MLCQRAALWGTRMSSQVKVPAASSATSTAGQEATAGRPAGIAGQFDRQCYELAHVIEDLLQADPRVVALQAAVTEICQLTGWDYAEIWIPDARSGLWSAHPYWYGDRHRYQAFRMLSEDVATVVPLPLVQRVARQQSTPWYEDVSLIPLAEYRRAKAAKAVGLKATLALPVMASGETLAVLVFMTTQVRERDGQLIDIVSKAASRLVDFFRPIPPGPSEPRLPEPASKVSACCFGQSLERLSPRENDVFRLSLDGLTVTEISAYLGLSHRTVEVHRASLLRKLGVATTTKLLAKLLAASVGERTRL